MRGGTGGDTHAVSTRSIHPTGATRSGGVILHGDNLYCNVTASLIENNIGKVGLRL